MAGVYLSVAQNPISPSPYTLYTCKQYTYSHRERGGGELNQREGERSNSSQSWVENTNMTKVAKPIKNDILLAFLLVYLTRVFAYLFFYSLAI
jgi:hypothetical protein